MKRRRILVVLAATVLLATGATTAKAQGEFPPFLIPIPNTVTEVPGSVRKSALFDDLDSTLQYQEKVVPTKVATWRKSLPAKYRTATHLIVTFVLDCSDYQWLKYSMALVAGKKQIALWRGEEWTLPVVEDLDSDYDICSSVFGPDFSVRFNPTDSVPPVVVPAATNPPGPSSPQRASRRIRTLRLRRSSECGCDGESTRAIKATARPRRRSG